MPSADRPDCRQLESRVRRKLHARFGEGRTEQGCKAPRRPPTPLTPSSPVFWQSLRKRARIMLRMERTASTRRTRVGGRARAGGRPYRKESSTFWLVMPFSLSRNWKKRLRATRRSSVVALSQTLPLYQRRNALLAMPLVTPSMLVTSV
jgi:hypothetical protein